MSNLLNKLYWSFCWRDVHSIIILDTNDKTPSCDIFTVLFWEWWEIQTLLLLNRPVNKPKLILAPITKLINLTQMQCKHCFFISRKSLWNLNLIRAMMQQFISELVTISLPTLPESCHILSLQNFLPFLLKTALREHVHICPSPTHRFIYLRFKWGFRHIPSQL